MAKMTKAEKLLKQAALYREYGPDYDRNIDAAAIDLEDAMKRDRPTKTWYDVLKLRLDRKALDEALEPWKDGR